MAGKDYAMGLGITIPKEVTDGLDKLEEKINQLETTTNSVSANIVAAFQRMAEGVKPFAESVATAEKGIKALGKANVGGISKSFSKIRDVAGSITEVSEKINAMGGTGADGASSWMRMSESVGQLNQRQKELLSMTKEYEALLARIQDFGAYSGADPEWYSQAKAEYEANKQAIASYREKQQALVDSERELTKQQRLVESLKNLENERTSLPEQRKNEELKRMNEYYRELEKTSAKAAREEEANQKKLAAAREKSAREEEAQQKKLLKLKEEELKAYLASPAGALKSADEAKTYTQRAQAMKNLEAAIKSLDSTDSKYQSKLEQLRRKYLQLKTEQDKVTQSLGQMSRQQHNLMNTSDQLMRRLALVFSVSQVTMYVKKLAEVRGEFELQNAALTAILQNKDEADKLFGQITQLAVQSPFNLKELVRYTKELAAYRVESDKLYDTTKMLADVSAGLGVDMSRLILAFGQVKAANYLRGTELRQFSEAGINILGELSTYFSELENRAVSVGEVFDMVSRRMVSFRDVEEIFRRITSEGGIFANMQEVQSRTLAGMISNLQDSVDIMLNDIGKESDSALKGAVTLTKNLLENWRTIAAIGKGIIIPLVLYKTTMAAIVQLNKLQLRYSKQEISIRGILLNLKRSETLAQQGLNAAAKANPYILAASVLIGTISSVVSLIKNTRLEQEKLNKIINEGVSSAQELSANFRRLADIAVSDSSSVEEQNSALEELNRTYSELIPSQKLTMDALKEMKGDYDSVTAAIYSKIEAQTKEKQIQEVLTKSGEDSGKWVDKIIKRLNKYGVSTEAALTITREFQERIKKGDYTTSEEAVRGISDMIKEYTGNLYAGNRFWLENGRLAKNLYDVVTSTGEKIDEINGKKIEPFRIGGATDTFQQLSEGLKEAEGDIKEWKKKIKDDKSLSFQFQIEVDEAAKDAQIKSIEDYIQSIRDAISSGQIPEKDVVSAQNVIADGLKKIQKIRISDTIDDIQNLRVEMSKLTGVDFGKIRVTEMLETEGLSEYIKKVQDEVKSMKEVIDLFAQAEEQGQRIPQMQQDSLIGIGNNIENYRKTYEALLLFLQNIAFIPEDKKTGSGKDPNIEMIKKWISLIKEAKTQYEDLRKKFGEEVSTEEVHIAYDDSLIGAGLEQGFVADMTFDVSGVLSAFDTLMKKMGKKYEQYFREAMDGIRVDVNKDDSEKAVNDIKEMFSGLMGDYEITTQLDYTGLDKGSIARMFGVDNYSLEMIKDKLDKTWMEYANIQEKALAESEGRAAKVYDNIDDAVKSFGKDGAEAYANMISQLTDAQKKESDKWLKQFIESLKDSYDKISQVQNEGGTAISFAKKFFDEGKLTAEQFAVIVRNVVKEVNDETSRIKVDMFKETPDYIKAMGDLSAYSAAELQELLDKLEKLIAESAKDIDASDLKEYYETIRKVRQQMRNIEMPWKKSEFGKLAEYTRLQKEFNEEQENYNRILKERDDWQNKVDEAKTTLDNLKNIEASQGKSADLTNMIQQAQENLVNATQGLNGANNALNGSQSKMSSISSMMGNITGGAAGALAIVDMIIKGVYSAIKAVVELFNETKELAESFGKETDKGSWTDASIAFEMIGNFNQHVMDGWEQFKSGDLLGSTVSVIASIFEVIKGINSLKDNKFEKIIVEETEKVEELDRQYQRLADTIEDANSAFDLDKTRKAIQRNYEEQVKSYESMIAAEKAKKNPDEDQIKQWEDTLYDLKQTQEDNMEEILSTAGGVADEDFLSTTQDFVEQWLEAFKETKDGLSGLEDNFRDFFENILTQQASLAISEKFMEPFIKDLNAALDDSKLDTDEALALKDQFINEVIPNMDEALKNFFSPFIDWLSSSSADSLSGLQKGIEGITEETAQALEALLNSVRYYTADSNMQLRNIYSILSGAADLSTNPILAELRTQTRLITSINRTFSGVVKAGHTEGGNGIKVFIN